MRMNPAATATFVLIAAFVGGLLTGVLAERTLLGPPVAEAATGVAAPRPGSAEDRERLARELGLTSEQQAQIDAILDEQQTQIRSIMRETRPRTRAVLRETRSRIEEVLTPEQQARFEELHAARHRAEKPTRDH
jgi:Spy/CpxP family protein refolding chaperone